MICRYCGEYYHDCRCKAVRDMKLLIAEIRGCLLGLNAHPSDSPLNGCLISEGSKLKLRAIGDVLDRYDPEKC